MTDSDDALRDRVTRNETLVSTAIAEIASLRERSHDLANAVHVSVAETVALRGQVASIASSVEKLVDTVTALTPLQTRVESHEDSCLAAHKRNDEHFASIERKIDQSGRDREDGFRRIYDALWRAAYWLMGLLGSGMVALAGIVWWLAQPQLSHLFGH